MSMSAQETLARRLSFGLSLALAVLLLGMGWALYRPEPASVPSQAQVLAGLP
jgi:hypothetical protein